MVSVMCTGAIAPSLPYMAQHYSYIQNSKFLMRALMTIPHLMIFFVSIPLSFILEKVSKIKAITLAVLVYSVCGGYCYWVENIYIIIALRAILGICISTVLSVSSILIADLFEGDERKKTIGLQTTVMSIGTITFNLLSGQITDIFGWRYNFLLYFIPIIFVPISIIYLFPIQKSVQTNELKNKQEDKKEKIGQRSKKSKLLISIFILIVAFVNMTMYYMIPLQLPFFLTSFKGVTAGKISFVLSIETLTSAIGGVVYSKISKKIERFGLVGSISLLLMMLCYIAMSKVRFYSEFFLFVPIYGFGMGLMMPNLTMWLISVNKKSKVGMMMGCFYSALYLGKFSCSILLYVLNTKFGINDARTIYFLSSILILIMASLMLLFEFAFNLRKKYTVNS